LAEKIPKTKEEETWLTLADLRAEKYFIINRKKVSCQAQEGNGQNIILQKKPYGMDILSMP
jgi:hypothetical protein